MCGKHDHNSGIRAGLQLTNGHIQWQFEKNVQTMTIVISRADLKLGPARLDARLNIVGEGGQLVGVQMLLGVPLLEQNEMFLA
jgi:hypothetical protein